MPWLVGCAADFCGINQLHLPEFLFSNFSFLYKIENFISVRPLTSTRTLRLPTHVCPTFGMQGWHRGRVLEGCRLVAEGSRRVLRQIEDNRHHTFLTTNGPRSTSWGNVDVQHGNQVPFLCDCIPATWWLYSLLRIFQAHLPKQNKTKTTFNFYFFCNVPSPFPPPPYPPSVRACMYARV